MADVNNLSFMLKSLFNLFFPNVCSGCYEVLMTNEPVICAACRHNLPLTFHHENTENEMLGKFYGRLPLEHASAMLYFHKKGIVQNLIWQLKYRGHQEVGTILGEWYGKSLKTAHKKHKFDMIIPVPLHRKRFKERGYNQLTTFGQSLSKSLEIPYKEDILHRDIYTLTQTKKSFFDRTTDKKAMFGIHQNTNIQNKHFLLIDDVVTTGSTLESCGRVLMETPGSKISIVCIAYTH